MKSLVEITNKVYFDLIYSSNIDDISIDLLQRLLIGRHGIMLFLISHNGDIFGSYNSEQISRKKDEPDFYTIENDDNACVFKVNKTTQKLDTYRLKDKSDPSLYFINNAEKARNGVIGVQNAFNIKLNCSVSESKDFSRLYNVPEGRSILMNIQSQTQVPIETFLILEWK